MDATPTARPKPTPTPSDPASEPDGAASTPPEEPVADQPIDAAPPGAGRPVSQAGGFGLVHAAFLLGGLLLSLGVGLLLRLRHLTRAAAGETEDPPVDRRWERPAPAGRW